MGQGLMFYQNKKRINNISSVQMAGGSTYITSIAAVKVANNTLKYNNECTKLINHLNKYTEAYRTVVQREIAAHSGDIYDGMRDRGVKLAWRYEKADIQMGGKGSANWNRTQRDEILYRPSHTVHGQDGHHINNVNEHPKEQANPNNIKFLSERKHLEAHEGDWRNSTEGKMIDKNKMLKKTNIRRVLKNELFGVGAAAAIGFGIGFTIGAVSTLAINGFSPENFKIALGCGIRTGGKAAIVSTVGYGVERVVTFAVQRTLTNLGIQLAEGLSKAVCAGVTGSIAILGFAVVEFINLKREGKTTKDAILCVGKHVLLSLAGIGLSLFLGYLGGPVVGIVTSVTFLSGSVAHNVISIKNEIRIIERVNIETVRFMKPSFV